MPNRLGVARKHRRRNHNVVVVATMHDSSMSLTPTPILRDYGRNTSCRPAKLGHLRRYRQLGHLPDIGILGTR